MSGDCWLWTDALTSEGYGTFSRGGKQYGAHRIAFELSQGEIPAGIEVDHMCFTRHCVRPIHLRAATHKQNQENRKGAQRNSKSGVRGVSWDSASGKWLAGIRHNGRKLNLGRYEDIAEAAAVVAKRRGELFSANPMQVLDTEN